MLIAISVLFVLGIIVCGVKIVCYKSDIRKAEEEVRLIKEFDIDTMIRQGYGFLEKDKFDKLDEREIQILSGDENISVLGSFQKQINIKHNFFTIQRYTFDSPSRKFPVFLIITESKQKKFFAWQFKEIIDFLETN